MKWRTDNTFKDTVLPLILLFLGLFAAPAGIWWYSGTLAPALKTFGGAIFIVITLVCSSRIADFSKRKGYDDTIGVIHAIASFILLGAYITWAFDAWQQVGIIAGLFALMVVSAGLGAAMEKMKWNTLKDVFYAALPVCIAISGITWWLSDKNLGLSLLVGGGFSVIGFIGMRFDEKQAKGEQNSYAANLGNAALLVLLAGCITWYIDGDFRGFKIGVLIFGILAFIGVSIYQFARTYKKTAAGMAFLAALPFLYSWFPGLIATAFMLVGVVALIRVFAWFHELEFRREQERFSQSLRIMQKEAIDTYGDSHFQDNEAVYNNTAEAFSKARIKVKAVPLDQVEGVILGKIEPPGKPARYVDFREGDHLLTIAPTGAGKGIGSIVPALLTYPGGALVIDPKGENAAITMRRRREMGQDVYLFDPFGVVTHDTAAWNPIDLIHKGNPRYADDAAAIADALAVPPGGKADPHWYASAMELLTAIILYLGMIETDPKKKNLSQLRVILTSDLKTLREFFDHIHSTTSGPVRDAASTVVSKSEKELSSVISTAQTYTRFLRSPNISRTLSHSSFNPADLHSGKASAFIIVPGPYMNAYSGWMRLMITHFLNGINLIGRKPARQILFIIDEAAAVGNLKSITDSYAQMRSYGIQLWPFFQDRAQIKATYADIGDTMVTNAAVKQIFGINDHATAKWISDSLGKRGIVTEQHSYEPIDPNNPPRNSIGFAIRERALRTPDELGESAFNILMFQKGIKMELPKLAYFEQDDFRENNLYDDNPQLTGGGPGPLPLLPDEDFPALQPPPEDEDDEQEDDTYGENEDEDDEETGEDESNGEDNPPEPETDPIEDLNNLVGLDAVKEQVKKTAALVKLAERRRSKKLSDLDITHHLIFTGNPGTGKTTVARIMGRIYKKYGVLKSGHLVEVGRKDLVGEYWGHSPQRTQEIINRALDGILFIDEAYALNIEGGSNGDPFGQEVISTLLAAIENHRNRLVVIAAGYSEEMGRFISSNPGLASRFKTTIDFPDYGPAELVQIFEEICRTNSVELANAKARKKLKEAVQNIHAARDAHFGNGRAMRNLFEACIANVAQRTDALTTQELKDDDMNITAADIPDDIKAAG